MAQSRSGIFLLIASVLVFFDAVTQWTPNSGSLLSDRTTVYYSILGLSVALLFAALLEIRLNTVFEAIDSLGDRLGAGNLGQMNPANLGVRTRLKTKTLLSVFDQIEAGLSFPFMLVGVLLMIWGALQLSTARDIALEEASFGVGLSAIGLALRADYRVRTLLHELRRGEIDQKIAVLYNYASQARGLRPNGFPGASYSYFFAAMIADIRAMKNVMGSMAESEKVDLRTAKRSLVLELWARYYDYEANRIVAGFAEIIPDQ